MNDLLKLILFETLAPQVNDQLFGQQSLVLAPTTVGFADSNKHFHQERLMEIVHQLDKAVFTLGNEVRVLVHAEFAAGNVQPAALVEQTAKLRRQARRIELGHAAHYWAVP